MNDKNAQPARTPAELADALDQHVVSHGRCPPCESCATLAQAAQTLRRLGKVEAAAIVVDHVRAGLHHDHACEADRNISRRNARTPRCICGLDDLRAALRSE